MQPSALAAIRRWLAADFHRSLRVDYFPSAKHGYEWSVGGIDRHKSHCVKSVISGPTMRKALEGFAKSLKDPQ
jgi:hypothetical protein